MLPNGDFAISAFATAKSELNSKAVNILFLSEFEVLVLELVIRGNKEAIAFQRSLVGLALMQLG